MFSILSIKMWYSEGVSKTIDPCQIYMTDSYLVVDYCFIGIFCFNVIFLV